MTLLRFCLCVFVLADVSLASKSRDKYPYYPISSTSSKNGTEEAALAPAAAASVYYDQRQTGKYNINVNIKDVAIISIDPETLASNVGVSGILTLCSINVYII